MAEFASEVATFVETIVTGDTLITGPFAKKRGVWTLGKARESSQRSPWRMCDLKNPQLSSGISTKLTIVGSAA